MEVANLPQFVANIALIDAVLKYAKRSSGGVARFERLENCLCGQHAALHRQMNSFEALRIEEAAGIADDQNAVDGVARHRVPAAVGQRFCSVTDQLPAIEQL